ncbi:TerB N-terminal domain-containing protein [Coraliomargarita parva]|uniref:tellurite resistance TerB family protein n=1 Tax=Coraliomargarita parva TaxID=3014050 RepID=UPI0022B4D9A9|nr:TerB N-terminal domain-containing protein [Coraliomargarita parva]
MKVVLALAIIFGIILGGMWGGIGAGILVGFIFLVFKSSGKTEEASRSVSSRTRSKGSGDGDFTIRVELGGARYGHTRGGEDLNWVAHGDSVEVAGRNISAGLVYYVDGDAKVFEPSALNRKLPVGKAAEGVAAELSYYPCYEYLTPQQRGTYLDWLANDRIDVDPGVREFGYIFLFFYGLERRVLIDGDFSDDIAHEIARLMVTYSPHGRSKSLPSYFSQLLHFWGYHQGEERYAQIWPWILGLEHSVLSEDELALILGSLASRNLNVQADVAMEIARFDQNASRSNVLKRSSYEFKTLFHSRFSTVFPDGVPLKLGSRVVIDRYRPASASLLDGGVDCSRLEARATYASILSSHRKKLVAIWNECCTDLSGYVRAKSKSANKELDLLTLIATPPELRQETVDKIKPKFDELLAEGTPVDEFHFVAAGSIAAFFGTERREKYTPTQSKQLAEGLECLGFAVEPDPRTHGSGWNANKELAMLDLSIGGVPSAGFLGRCALVQMAASVAASDGGFDLRESETIACMIESEDMPEADRMRLRAWSALLERDLNNAPATIIKVAKAVPAVNSQAVAQVLCHVATADGIVTKDEERMLERIFRALNLSPEITSLLKKELDGFDEVAVSKSVQADPGESIPRPVSIAETKFKLDRDRIERLSAETAEVIGILSVAMAEAEEEVETPEVEGSDASGETIQEEAGWIEGLDEKFIPFVLKLVSKERWSKSEFESAASELHLMPNAVYDAINEWSDEYLGDFLLEDEDPVSVNLELIPS